MIFLTNQKHTHKLILSENYQKLLRFDKEISIFELHNVRKRNFLFHHYEYNVCHQNN